MLLDEIATRLTSTGVAAAKLPGSTSTLAWTLYKSFMPSTPDKAMCVTETSGYAPFAGFSLAQPAFQVRVRGAPIQESATAYSEARAKIEAVRAALHGIQPTSMTGTYAGLLAEQEPFSLGLDEESRPELAVNFRAMRDSTG